MKLAFTGDTSFHNPDFDYTSLSKIRNLINNSYLIINLESPILDEEGNLIPIKEKGGLKSSLVSAKNLRFLSPYLINLSNNHINDYGNRGVEKTKEFLEKIKMKYIGAGYKKESHNIRVDNKNKIVYFSYATRETDNTGAPLFNTEKFMGPKQLSEELFSKQSLKYKSYKKILLVHWGEEYRDYPSENQRKISRNLIDSGADLIIGSHSHMVQGFEVYKNKYIFYSLGNFLMPDIIDFKKKTLVKWVGKENYSIIPVFNIGKKISLNKLILLKKQGNKLRILSLKNFIKNLNKFFSLKNSFYEDFYVKRSKKTRFKKILWAIFSYKLIQKLKDKLK